MPAAADVLLLRGFVLALAVSGVPVEAAAQVTGPGAGSATAPASPLRVVRTTSGTRGEIRDGRYVVLDPRTTFRLPEDATVVVHFEWLGATGKHLMVGTWRGPAGTTTTSSFEYVATERSFAAYWELTLPANAPRGQWSLEATVDGMPAGIHAFEIVGPEAAAPVTSPARLPLTRREIFARTLEASLLVEALAADGTRLAVAPGFLVDDMVVATSFGVINNAARLRIKGRTAGAVETDRVVAWNRRHDWALAVIPESLGTPSVRAPSEARPGDACYSVTADPAGNLAVASCEVVGTNLGAPAPRISVGFASPAGTPGAPVFNEYGEAIGMMTEPQLEDAWPTQTALRLGQVADMPAPPALPIAALPVPPWPSAVTLTALAERGTFVPPVALGRHVIAGGFASKVPPRGASTFPEGQRVEFEASDKTMATFVTWGPTERIKGESNLRLYDMDNTQVGVGKPHKISVRASQVSMSVWSFAVPPPGVYRADVALDGVVAWRGHFRVKP